MKKNDVFWWMAAPLRTLEQVPVPPAADVVIVGAGYTGLSAAIRLARAGRSVQVFDRERPGEGASTRNGGITSGNLRPGLRNWASASANSAPSALVAESKAAREDLYRFIDEEKIDCDFALTGRFSGASAPADYEKLAREAEMLNRTLGIEAYAVPRAEQRSVLGTDYLFRRRGPHGYRRSASRQTAPRHAGSCDRRGCDGARANRRPWHSQRRRRLRGQDCPRHRSCRAMSSSA